MSRLPESRYNFDTRRLSRSKLYSDPGRFDVTGRLLRPNASFVPTWWASQTRRWPFGRECPTPGQKRLPEPGATLVLSDVRVGKRSFDREAPKVDRMRVGRYTSDVPILRTDRIARIRACRRSQSTHPVGRRSATYPETRSLDAIAARGRANSSDVYLRTRTPA